MERPAVLEIDEIEAAKTVRRSIRLCTQIRDARAEHAASAGIPSPLPE
jgi:hypothetical protein